MGSKSLLVMDLLLSNAFCSPVLSLSSPPSLSASRSVIHEKNDKTSKNYFQVMKYYIDNTLSELKFAHDIIRAELEFMHIKFAHLPKFSYFPSIFNYFSRILLFYLGLRKK